MGFLILEFRCIRFAPSKYASFRWPNALVDIPYAGSGRRGNKRTGWTQYASSRRKRGRARRRTRDDRRVIRRWVVLLSENRWGVQGGWTLGW